VFDFPKHFRDEQISGPFKLIVHDHYFSQNGECVIMKDDFSFESPLGALGRIANPVLKPYLTKLLTARNSVIKYYAESGEWMKILPSNYSSSANVST
jgi:ligand-binding SRPBCC domain-containing protein